MIDYKAYEIIKAYAEKRYKVSMEELYFINIVSEFFPLDELMLLQKDGGEDAVARFNSFVGEMYYSCLDSPYASNDAYLSPLFADPDGFKELCIRERHFNPDAWMECLSNMAYRSGEDLFKKYYFKYINQRQNYVQINDRSEIEGLPGPWKGIDYYKLDNGETIILYKNPGGTKVVVDENGCILDSESKTISEFLQKKNISVF